MKPRTKSLLKLICGVTILASLLIAGHYFANPQAISFNPETIVTHGTYAPLQKVKAYKSKPIHLSAKEKIIISELKNMEGGYKYDNTPFRKTGSNQFFISDYTRNRINVSRLSINYILNNNSGRM